jgi:hypothetical protein
MSSIHGPVPVRVLVAAPPVAAASRAVPGNGAAGEGRASESGAGPGIPGHGRRHLPRGRAGSRT